MALAEGCCRWLTARVRSTLGQWTHLAFVCTATQATFYVNGGASASVALLPVPPGTALRIGASPLNPAAEELRI